MLTLCVVGNMSVQGMVSTQSTAVIGGRKLVPSLHQQQQHIAVASSHIEQPSNLAELLLGIMFSITLVLVVVVVVVVMM